MNGIPVERSLPAMIRMLPVLLITVLLSLGGDAAEPNGRIVKVLPVLLDKDGRHTLSPSLYERDAYQAHLRQHPGECFGRMYSIQWKGRSTGEAPLQVRIELRGATEGKTPKRLSLTAPPLASRRKSHWTHLRLDGDDYREFGKVTAWRATLWSGDILVDEYKSFLW